MSDCTVLIGGDICPRGSSLSAFERGEAAELFGFLRPLMAEADYVVANLECPLTERGAPVVKTGPNFKAPTRCASALREAGIDAVTLANNHIMDQGAEGLQDTMEACEAVGLQPFGAGPDLASAGEPHEREINGVSVAFLGVAEHEFSIVGPKRWGANPLDVMRFVRFMRERGGDYDHVVVLLHGGTEHYPLPSPELQRVCRFLAEEGASAVICQHSHHVGAIEVVNNAPIIYGQGNFLFENSRMGDEWQRGFLVQLHLSKDRADTKYSLVPFRQREDALGVRAPTAEEDAQLRSDIEAWSAVLADAEELERRWLAFCEQRSRVYFSLLRGQSRLVRGANRVIGFAEKMFPRRAVITLLALFRCQAHREAVISLLEARYEKYYHDHAQIRNDE